MVTKLSNSSRCCRISAWAKLTTSRGSGSLPLRGVAIRRQRALWTWLLVAAPRIAAGMAVKICPEEVHYFEEVIEPLFRASPWVEFVGEVGGRLKDEFHGNAHTVLFPINWAEPFGLVMIEAMACGTPVVAFRRGSVPEVMTDGVTGFVVDDVPGAIAAVGRDGGLSRRARRRAFVERFDAARMARDYLAVYRKLAADGSDRVRSAPPAPELLALSPQQGLDRRRPSHSQAPLMGVLPGVG
jgi:hypothetical protein